MNQYTVIVAYRGDDDGDGSPVYSYQVEAGSPLFAGVYAREEACKDANCHIDEDDEESYRVEIDEFEVCYIFKGHHADVKY